MGYFLKFVVSHPKAVIIATLALTAGFAGVIVTRGLEFNGSPEMLSRRGSVLEYFNKSRETFGDDRVIIVALTTADAFTPQFMEKLDRLTRRLAALGGVDEAQSLSNIKAITRGEGGVTISRLIPGGGPRGYDAAALAGLREQVTRDPLYAKLFISPDGRTAAINVFLRPGDEASSRAAAEEVERIAKEEAGTDEVLLAGVPVVEARAIRSMMRDIVVLSPVAGLLCAAVFVAAFRGFWGAAVPLLALLFGLVWTVGIMSAAGRPFTMATLTMPTVLMAVGGSYIFHVLNQYRISMSQIDSAADLARERAAWLDGLKFITPAVVVSGTTTMAGFGAMASSEVPTARDMGIFDALGVLAMLLLTLTFVPAALALLPADVLGRQSSGQKDYATWLNRLLKQATALILYRRRLLLSAFLVATIVTGAGVAWLRVNTDYLRIFPPSSETVQAAEKVSRRLAGAATVQMVVSGSPGAVTNPQFLDAVGRLERRALEQHGVDSAISVADIIARLNSALNATVTEEIPKDPARLRAMVDDYLAGDESISRLVSRDRSSTVVVLRTSLTSSNDLRGLSSALEEWSRSNMPAGVTARATGSLILLNDASDAIAESQLSSLALALAAIYLMMVALFRSAMTALLALIPNLIPIIGYFGFLGWAGITLDITTSLIASAALGLAVDNAVHMIRRYRQSVAERATESPEGRASGDGWAMWLTMLRTGKPMTLANLMLIAAFLIFMLSSFVPVRLAGALWAFGIFACLVADLMFLPALMKTGLFSRAALGESRPGGAGVVGAETSKVAE
jgi:predicted RND superfamily exporter protein